MQSGFWCFLATFALVPAIVTASDTPIPTHVVQAVIDDSKLQPFFHFEDPVRTPLRVVALILEPDPSLSASGHPVLIIPPGTFQPGPSLRILDFEVFHDVAIVRVAYDIEGVEGRFIFTKGPNSTWHLRVSDVWERSAG